ncbi:hypothetical protein CDAR_503781 [Caerostris darwini]|uniref:Uncharacterized protein n=1 Tax=Caerostris darwini TaxID=1538125 RepID=A0AAV4PFM3_9ARAC|nr:hypothetical protein CDAR_503781 [Caerostris darwini]
MKQRKLSFLACQNGIERGLFEMGRHCFEEYCRSRPPVVKRAEKQGFQCERDSPALLDSWVDKSVLSQSFDPELALQLFRGVFDFALFIPSIHGAAKRPNSLSSSGTYKWEKRSLLMGSEDSHKKRRKMFSSKISLAVVAFATHSMRTKDFLLLRHTLIGFDFAISIGFSLFDALLLLPLLVKYFSCVSTNKVN